MIKGLSMSMKYTSSFFVWLFFVNGQLVNASETVNRDLQIHGFVAQGVIQADKSNYVNDDGDISTELTEIGLNASYLVSPDIRLAGQVVYLNGGNRYSEGARLDYALIDWGAFTNKNWQVNLYLGRFKNYHWLYSSTRDVPMTRPSIILPQGVYFDATRDMSVGGDGAALTAKYTDDVLGDLDFNISTGKSSMSSEQTEIIMGHNATGDIDHDEDLQASIYWQPSFSSWRFGLALTDADFIYNKGEDDVFLDGEIKLERYYINADFQGENWTFSAELLQERMILEDTLFPGFHRDTTGQGGFFQTQYTLNSEIQLLARYEHYYVDKNDKNGKKLEESTHGAIPRYFGYQHDATIGLTYNLSSNMQLQVEHHWIKGTARLTPVIIPETNVNNSEYWTLWAMQLMYWF